LDARREPAHGKADPLGAGADTQTGLVLSAEEEALFENRLNGLRNNPSILNSKITLPFDALKER
jgi:hypothetical protein